MRFRNQAHTLNSCLYESSGSSTPLTESNSEHNFIYGVIKQIQSPFGPGWLFFFHIPHTPGASFEAYWLKVFIDRP